LEEERGKGSSRRGYDGRVEERLKLLSKGKKKIAGPYLGAKTA